MKEEVIQAAVVAIQAQDTQVLTDQLGIVYDADRDSTGGVGTYTQEQFDAKLAEALGADEALDVQALADAQAAFDVKFAKVQSDLEAMTEKEGLEAKAVKDVQASIDSVQAAFDAIKALFPTLPMPVPVEPEPEVVPEPVEPMPEEPVEPDFSTQGKKARKKSF